MSEFVLLKICIALYRCTHWLLELEGTLILSKSVLVIIGSGSLELCLDTATFSKLTILNFLGTLWGWRGRSGIMGWRSPGCFLWVLP